MWPAIIAGGASLLGSVISSKTSQSNAREQMDFQQQASDTAYQRQMADMKAAGLNPLLASKMGGASTPTGAMGQVQDYGKAAVTGVQAMQTDSNIDLQASQEKLNDVKTELSKALVPGAEAVSTLTSAGRDLIQGLDKMIKNGIGSYGDIPQEAMNLLGEVYNKAKQLGGTYFENVERLLKNELNKFDNVLELLSGEQTTAGAILK